uniref:Uncharacterized protein n=1 Tax=Rhizophagus irregularis (strain DAOM 181602 / DAOM 197198 / MUCL 43194) TaxID=747089 RepID=U9TH57_RHIID
MESSGSANKKDEIEGYEDDKSRTRIIALAVREAVAVAFGVNDADWNAASFPIIVYLYKSPGFQNGIT